MRIIREALHLAPFERSLFIPTMGALHDGHSSLIRRAALMRKEHGTPAASTTPPIIVSVFVNPTQFNDPKDLERYPRTLERDAALCEAAGADVLWAPPPEEIYPPGIAIPIPPLPPVATQPGLEDRLRPGHFAGVCQVVARLFELVRPAAAFFGEKDWQQLQVITAMTSALQLPIRIIPVPTVRESDGLAMSSRNVFLSSVDRAEALAISRALRVVQGESTPESAERAMRALLGSAKMQVEYAVVRDAATLMPTAQRFDVKRPMRALIAGWVGRAERGAENAGGVRLIDNSAWEAAGTHTQ